MSVLAPFQLLEINIISAQDLAPVSKKMRTYATAWVHSNRKLSTRVDAKAHNNPTWNDKFVFRVDDEFLCADTSAVMIEIYARHWFRDLHVGTVRVLVGNLIPPPVRINHRQHHLGMRFVALQIRRPSGRPQGILNIGVALLDGSMRSMPLYTQLSASAVGFRDFMAEEDPHNNQHHNNNTTTTTNPLNVKPILRRTRSERSERVTFDNISTNSSSLVGVAQIKLANGKASSIVSGSDYVGPQKGKGKKGKASSVISGAELREKPKERGKRSKASSLVSGSEIMKKPKHKAQNEKSSSPIIDPKLEDPAKDKVADEKLGSELSYPPANKVPNEKPITKISGFGPKETPVTAIGKPISKFNGFDFGPPKGSYVNNNKFIFGGPVKSKSIWSDSEVGPSPSEVAAAMAVERYPLDENRSSVLDGWSLDESVEGLRSKLERWRTELPPLYDRGFSASSIRSTSQRVRRHTDGGSGTGLFSCFGNIYGYECQCICGKPTAAKRSYSGRFQSPSASAGRSFV